jgi:hypothetical protein
MEKILKHTFLMMSLIVATMLKGQNMQSTKYSTPESIVLQICPKELAGETEINGKKYRRIAAFIFLPNSKPGTTISCPLNYFQESCSLPGKWIQIDSGQKVKLDNLDKLQTVIVTKKNNSNEEKVDLADSISQKLFDYFNFDVEHNLEKYIGFDCYAFQSLIRNVVFFPPAPSWNYNKTEPNVGDVVVLTTDENLPDSIKHWATYLGEDLYLSKFGKSGEGSQSLVTIMNLEGMMLLYDCKFRYTANAKHKANPWNGFIKQ